MEAEEPPRMDDGGIGEAGSFAAVPIRRDILDEFEKQKQELLRLLASASTDERRQSLQSALGQLEEKRRTQIMDQLEAREQGSQKMGRRFGSAPATSVPGTGSPEGGQVVARSRRFSSSNSSLASLTDDEDDDGPDEDDEILFSGSFDTGPGRARPSGPILGPATAPASTSVPRIDLGGETAHRSRRPRVTNLDSNLL